VKNSTIMLVTSSLMYPLSLGADQVGISTLPDVKGYAASFAANALDAQFGIIEKAAVDGYGFKYLDLSYDTAGKVSLMSVYGLYGTQNIFVFNQASLINDNDRNTVNLGFGVRQINDADTVILGANAFYDRELETGHSRTGFGLEFMTSTFELRANSYLAASGEIDYSGALETPLSGYDVKLTANMPYFYSSDLYLAYTKWLDDGMFYSSSSEFGLNAEIFPNLNIGIANKKTDSSDNQAVLSVSYSIPLGNVQRNDKKLQSGIWSDYFTPIRDKLYVPVQRENRIMKKIVSDDTSDTSGAITFSTF
jgi:hypothetical protein